MKYILSLITAVLWGVCTLFPADIEQPVRTAVRDIQKASEELGALREQIAEQRIRHAEQVGKLRDEVGSLMDELSALEQKNRNAETLLSDTEQKKRIAESEIERIEILLKQEAGDIRASLSMPEQQKFSSELETVSALTASSSSDILKTGGSLLDLVLRRLDDNRGGSVFEGSATDRGGKVFRGHFLHAGPVDYFLSSDGALSGAAGLLTGRNRPTVVFDVPPGTLRSILNGEETEIPVDFTGGQALQMRETERSWTEHIKKGGVIMFPILGLGLICIAVALVKMLFFARISTDISPVEQEVIELVRQGNPEEAEKKIDSLGRPCATVFLEGIHHRDASREELEEIMHSRIAEEVPYLEKYLSVLSVSAAASPLLGLLGTVTGMIHTFNLITVFGTGKARLLSSGISEALITTEYGLIIAIPALLVHAYFASRVRKIIGILDKGVGLFITGLKSGE